MKQEYIQLDLNPELNCQVAQTNLAAKFFHEEISQVLVYRYRQHGTTLAQVLQSFRNKLQLIG